MRFKATQIDSPLGEITLGATDRGLCLCEFGSPDRIDAEKRQLNELLVDPVTSASEGILELGATELLSYFREDLVEFTVPVHAPGTPWQRQVWDALTKIPLGTTTTYGRLAERLGSPGAARAVGLANGQNRVAIILPCHRVIDSSGALRGYGGGLENKAWLLDHERRIAGESLFQRTI